MTRKIFNYIISVALIVLFVSIGVATGFSYEHFNDAQQKQLKQELYFVAEGVNKNGTKYIESVDSDTFRYCVIDKDGVVLYDTQADVAEMGNHADREEFVQAIEYGRGSSERKSSTLMEKTFYEAVLLDNGDVLRVSVSRLTMGALVMNMLPLICLVVVIVVTVVLFLSYKMSRKVTEPLMRLDLENPSVDNAYPELRPILTKLHRQHNQIKLQMEELHRKSGEFEQSISSMNEGLVLLDEHGMVLSMNNAARKIFRTKEQVKDFLSVDRTDKMSRAIWGALEGKRSEFTEQREGCEYQFNISPIESDGRITGTLILAFDITDKAFAERNRREFTANVSHELKTPLQAIIGSAELLENGLVKPGDTERFVGNIKNEAIRLVSLIDDIIRLSQLDEQKNPPTESVDLYEVSGEVVNSLLSSAEKKNIRLELCGQSCVIKGVRRYLYEMIYNLCDNAVKYNKDGGEVVITVEKDAVIVRDTGIGIPQSEQSRVFERFYRVDKSHSRLVGGTGLGLAIVKHGAAYHNAEISLESEEGKGTTITIMFGKRSL